MAPSAVAVLPVAVAAMVKFNDVVTGALQRSPAGGPDRGGTAGGALPAFPRIGRRPGVSVLNRSPDSDGYRFSRARDVTGRHGAPNGASERRFRRSA
jgi:hypothetical protein